VTENTVSAFKIEFEKRVKFWRATFAEGRIGTEHAELTAAEIEVFEIAPERYPRMLALWEAYEDIKGICDMGAYGESMLVAIVSALGLQPRADASQRPRVSVEEFQKLGEVVGVSYRDAFAMFYKLEFWYRRARLVTYADEA